MPSLVTSPPSATARSAGARDAKARWHQDVGEEIFELPRLGLMVRILGLRVQFIDQNDLHDCGPDHLRSPAISSLAICSCWDPTSACPFLGDRIAFRRRWRHSLD